jgi:hypothetical protein
MSIKVSLGSNRSEFRLICSNKHIRTNSGPFIFYIVDLIFRKTVRFGSGSTDEFGIGRSNRSIHQRLLQRYLFNGREY